MRMHVVEERRQQWLLKSCWTGWREVLMGLLSQMNGPIRLVRSLILSFSMSLLTYPQLSHSSLSTTPLQLSRLWLAAEGHPRYTKQRTSYNGWTLQTRSHILAWSITGHRVRKRVLHCMRIVYWWSCIALLKQSPLRMIEMQRKTTTVCTTGSKVSMDGRHSNLLTRWRMRPSFIATQERRLRRKWRLHQTDRLTCWDDW